MSTNTPRNERAAGARASSSIAPYRVAERVRWSDVDAAGIVCYGAYLRYFELAETELFRSVGLTAPIMLDRYGLWLVRRRVECDFHEPVRLDEELDVFAFVSAIGRTSLTLEFLVRRAGERRLAVDGRYRLVSVDRDGLRPVPVPEEVRRALASARLDTDRALERIGCIPSTTP